METRDSRKVRKRVIRVIKKFCAVERDLLKRDSKEENLTQRLSIHLCREFEKCKGFEGFRVDCEYNREGELKDPKRGSQGSPVLPDIIIHHRGTNKRNLVVIEAKKSTHTHDKYVNDREDLDYLGEDERLKYKKDRQRLKDFMQKENQNYQNAFFIIFHVTPNDPLGVTLERIESDGSVAPGDITFYPCN